MGWGGGGGGEGAEGRRGRGEGARSEGGQTGQYGWQGERGWHDGVIMCPYVLSAIGGAGSSVVTQLTEGEAKKKSATLRSPTQPSGGYCGDSTPPSTHANIPSFKQLSSPEARSLTSSPALSPPRPSSSAALSAARHIGVLSICGSERRWEAIPLRTARPFAMEDLVLAEGTTGQAAIREIEAKVPARAHAPYGGPRLPSAKKRDTFAGSTRLPHKRVFAARRQGNTGTLIDSREACGYLCAAGACSQVNSMIERLQRENPLDPGVPPVLPLIRVRVCTHRPPLGPTSPFMIAMRGAARRAGAAHTRRTLQWQCVQRITSRAFSGGSEVRAGVIFSPPSRLPVPASSFLAKRCSTTAISERIPSY